MLKKLLNIGIACKETPIDRAIKIFNTAEPQAMQFNLKTVEDMQKLATGLKKTARGISVHLPNPQFNEITGIIKGKKKVIEMLKQNTPNNLDLITVHLGWEDADLVLDKRGGWKKTDLANKIARELSDLFIVGIQAGKTIAIENVRYKPHKHKFCECLGSKPEHLIMARNEAPRPASRDVVSSPLSVELKSTEAEKGIHPRPKNVPWFSAKEDKIAQIISSKIDMSIDKVLSKIGYTLDVGHAVGNAHLSQDYSIEAWLQRLGKDIKLIHIHDMRPMIEDGIKIEKTHLPLGEGIVDWESFFQLKNQYCPSVPMLLELTEENITKSVDYLEEENLPCRPRLQHAMSKAGLL